MGYDNTSGLGVYNQYGQRDTGGALGAEHSKNSVQTLSVNITGDSLNTGFMPPVYFPKGAKVVKAILRVDEVFAVSAAGTVAIGGTAPGTNGVVLTEAQLEAVGTKDVSAVAVGTWATASATGATATQKVTKAITGTVTAGSGKGTLLVEYINMTKV